MVEALYNTNKVIVTSKLWWHCCCLYVFLSFKVLWSSGHLGTHVSVLTSLATTNLNFFNFALLGIHVTQAYLSLPEGAASAAGLIAMMTDHYNLLVWVLFKFFMIPLL